MSLHQLGYPPLPADTARAAQAAFRQDNPYLLLGDRLDTLLAGIDLAGLDPEGENALPTLRLLALVTTFQYKENLPDWQAADAARTRLDWKYALHLPLNHPGLNPFSLCVFRCPLLRQKDRQPVFQNLLDGIQAAGFSLGSGEEISLQAQAVLLAVCRVSRLERIAGAMNQALEALAAYKPDLLRLILLPHWYRRYEHSGSITAFPMDPSEQERLALTFAADGYHLLTNLRELEASSLQYLPEINTLAREWKSQFKFKWGRIYWRPLGIIPCDRRDDFGY